MKSKIFTNYPSGLMSACLFNAISNTAPWQKPIILLFEDGDKYNSVLDVITDKYRHAFIISEPKYMTFVTKDNQTECLLNGKTVDAHKPEIDLYLYLERTPLLDIEALNYCIGLFQYEKKPVICCHVIFNLTSPKYQQNYILQD